VPLTVWSKIPVTAHVFGPLSHALSCFLRQSISPSIHLVELSIDPSPSVSLSSIQADPSEPIHPSEPGGARIHIPARTPARPHARQVIHVMARPHARPPVDFLSAYMHLGPSQSRPDRARLSLWPCNFFGALATYSIWTHPHPSSPRRPAFKLGHSSPDLPH